MTAQHPIRRLSSEAARSDLLNAAADFEAGRRAVGKCGVESGTLWNHQSRPRLKAAKRHQQIQNSLENDNQRQHQPTQRLAISLFHFPCKHLHFKLHIRLSTLQIAA